MKVVNHSRQEWIFYVYQTDIFNEGFPLAWLVSPLQIPVNNFINFYWAADYQFLMSYTGKLIPGVIVHVNQDKECNPSGKNHTEFTILPIEPSVGQLSEPFKAPSEGALYIKDGPTVPDEKFAVGIGMDGNGTIVKQAKANSMHEFIPPVPPSTYWVAAAKKMRVGTVLDIQTVTRAAKLEFPPNIYSMVATLTQDDTWKITRDQFDTAAGDSTRTTTTTTTNTRTNTTYCCALI